jgi:5-methylcytosine-specific restriction endonuclease McrA
VATRGVTRTELKALSAEGLTIEKIARRLRVSDSRRDLLDEARRDGERVVEAVCKTHGLSRHVSIKSERRLRCSKCSVEAVERRRRKVKAILVAEAGGECVVCGYSQHHAALQFHHLDPASKSFGLGVRGITRSLAKLRTEAAKCVLLCANCHAEVEVGALELPLESGASRLVRATDVD